MLILFKCSHSFLRKIFQRHNPKNTAFVKTFILLLLTVGKLEYPESESHGKANREGNHSGKKEDGRLLERQSSEIPEEED